MVYNTIDTETNNNLIVDCMNHLNKLNLWLIYKNWDIYQEKALVK